jgi:hypothetical protein
VFSHLRIWHALATRGSAAASFYGSGLVTLDQRLAAVCRTVGVPLIA